MTTELTVSITLDRDDQHDAARFEEALRGWLENQPGVTGMAIANRANAPASESIWRTARKAAFGPSLRNPFAP